MTDDLCRWDGDEQQTYPSIAAEERRLDEMMQRKCTRYDHFEDDPEFQYLMGRRIERYKLATAGTPLPPSPPKRKSPYREKRGRKRYRTQL
jgi:hypothetical protein